MLHLTSRVLGRVFMLPPPETYDIVVERDLGMPMPDGVTLLADHYSPRRTPRAPTIVIRSPYGRRGIWALLLARPFAERGMQVLIQSCRGTFGSGGTFTAFRHERADGLATLDWLAQQAWFTGEFATIGPSYLGLVQWAVAAEAGPGLRAMVPQITAATFRPLVYPGESFSLDTALTWIAQLASQEVPWRQRARARKQAQASLRRALQHLPLGEADRVAVGQPVSYYRDWLAHAAPDDPWWREVDFRAPVDVPVHLIGGWYDLFLLDQLADYRRLREAGQQPYLTIGPWTHSAPGLFPLLLRETLTWCRAHLLGDTARLRRAPVRLFVMGANSWRSYADWPPPGYAAQRWYLQPHRGLATAPPPSCPPDTYRYDPADPTPAVGGVSLSQNAGPRDNRALERRPDVLVYTSAVLADDVEAIGPVRAELYVTSSLTHTDFCVRLCDVDPAGRSVNICDGLLRLRPDEPPAGPDGCRRVVVELWSTAQCFRRGHRLRVQVASGAHPRWARNTGSGEPLATATRLVVADQAVFHDPEHPSALVLHVRQGAV